MADQTEQLAAAPAIKGTHVLILASADCANLDLTGKTGLTLGVFQTMNPWDIIKTYNLTG